MSRCIKFNRTVTLNDDEEFILVKCNVSKQNSSEEVYENMHARIPNKTLVGKTLIRNVTSTSDDRLSVLFYGVDSISRLNLKRTMPRTISFLKKHDFIELNGYNRIGDTFPNLLAILTGMNDSQATGKFWTRVEAMGESPFLWKNASDLGYVTLYADDELEMGTLHYNTMGIVEQQTDYYLRTFMLAANKYLNSKYLDRLKICTGPQMTADIIMNYARDFLKYIKTNLFFALFRTSSYSHSNINTPSCMDNRTLKFFQDVFEFNKTLNSTMIVFASNHGMRFGNIKLTYVGWLEDRLPFIYIWLPEWYRNKYREKYNNLLTNVNRLTTPYDLHMTLRDVIMRRNLQGYTCEATRNCRSLFQKIPWYRTCEIAKINEYLCACTEYTLHPTDDLLVKELVSVAVKKINKKLKSAVNKTTNSMMCQELGARHALTVRQAKYEEETEYRDFAVVFETMPGAARFETFIRAKYIAIVMGPIERINLYRNQSFCIPDADLKNYCFCVANRSAA